MLETWSEYDVGFFRYWKELLSFGCANVVGKLLNTDPGLFLAGGDVKLCALLSLYAARDSSSIDMRPGPITFAPVFVSGVWLSVFAWY